MTSRLVYNITDQTSDFNFAIAPKIIPNEEIIVNVVAAVNEKPKETAEEIRQNVAYILRTCKPPSPNLENRERDTLQNLTNNENLIILPAGKSKPTVVMNTRDYIKKYQM